MFFFRFWSIFVYTLHGHEWHFLIETMPEASGAVKYNYQTIKHQKPAQPREPHSGSLK